MKLENRDPYWFTNKGVEQIEETKNAKYLGYWCGKTKTGNWGERPIDVFYQAEPDTDAGHTHYFGLLIQDDKVLITNAESCFSNPMIGIVEDDTVYVSRYRHDYVQTPNGKIIDGGRDYVKTDQASENFVTVTVSDGEFIFEQKDTLDVEEDQAYRHPKSNNK